VRQQRRQQRGVAVRRLDHQLRLRRTARQRLKLADARGALGLAHRQVTHEREALAVQATGGQREQ